MAFKEVQNLDCDTTITLGGVDRKTGRKNPTSIEGYYLGSKDTGPNKFTPTRMDKVHIFQTAKGNTGVWCKSDLDRKLGAVAPGSMVRASFVGTVPTKKGNDMLKFKVEVDADNTIEVSTGSASDYSSAAADYDSDDDASAVGSDEDDDGPSVDTRLSAAESRAKVDALLNRAKTVKN